jgi:hypothetical protein
LPESASIVEPHCPPSPTLVQRGEPLPVKNKCRHDRDQEPEGPTCVGSAELTPP